MGTALDNRPLLVRLQKRILKKHGGTADERGTSLTDRFLTDSDSMLHQQSIDAINKLVQALESLTAGDAPGPAALDAARQLIKEHKAARK